MMSFRNEILVELNVVDYFDVDMLAEYLDD
jgi:hypothetical protein